MFTVSDHRTLTDFFHVHQTSFEIVRYCLVHWEQLSGEAPVMNSTGVSETGESTTLSLSGSVITSCGEQSHGHMKYVHVI